MQLHVHVNFTSVKSNALLGIHLVASDLGGHVYLSLSLSLCPHSSVLVHSDV